MAFYDHWLKTPSIQLEFLACWKKTCLNWLKSWADWLKSYLDWKKTCLDWLA